ncbi:MAG TPA: gliding motility-associated C-terminal domain-containing protein, partial [Mucilaginibacter sp.]|nr:gliding motility-associated C-terminal domain-containing protein [Mucilaginibacter sp.]
FTPNGDGKNDILYVYGTIVKSIKFYIYDQWGELIFTSNDQSYGWDGTYKGNKEPVGVYVYYVEVIADDGKKLTKKGTVTLIR